ncbi:MAG: flagellar protein FlaG [Peptococcaceae bacterium]|nr:flagellar protein FlaG [Peptococcaceae bacterium]
MIGPISPTSPQVSVLPVDTYPGQKLEDSRERPRPVVDRKDETPSAREEVPREEVEQAADKLNRLVGLIEKRMEFSVHEESRRIMVKIIDKNTGEILNEIPPEKILDLVSSLTEMVGVFLDKKV